MQPQWHDRSSGTGLDGMVDLVGDLLHQVSGLPEGTKVKLQVKR
jgi:hypothetical protein